jgi:cytoskeletal protein RodZ
MQSLGERLQEARQRLGVTTREAADVTKIRSDFLQAMEANQYESIPLTDVYKRGFTKIYAKYLRLDEEKAVADFNTHHSVRAVRRPLDAGADLDDTAEPTTAVAGLSLNKDATVWLVIGVAAVGLLAWALSS